MKYSYELGKFNPILYTNMKRNKRRNKNFPQSFTELGLEHREHSPGTEQAVQPRSCEWHFRQHSDSLQGLPVAPGNAVQGNQRHMQGNTTYGFCSLKAWQKIWILFLGWEKHPCWWNNEAIYQTRINYMCSLVKSWWLCLKLVLRVMLRGPLVSQHRTSPRWTGLCACPSAWPPMHHGPRGKSPSSSSSLSLSPGWPCDNPGYLRHLVCLARHSQLAEEQWPALSATLELNTILTTSIWSFSGLLWPWMELWAPILPGEDWGVVGWCLCGAQTSSNQLTSAVQPSQFKSNRYGGTINWTRAHSNCWVEPS